MDEEEEKRKEKVRNIRVRKKSEKDGRDEKIEILRDKEIAWSDSAIKKGYQ